MATPPTRVSYNVPASGNYTTSGTSKTTAAFDVQAGDLIVVLASVENASSIASVDPFASGGSITWTQRAQSPSAPTTDQSLAKAWTGVVGNTATGITVSLNKPGSDGTALWGFSATVFRNHGGVGSTYAGSNGSSSSAPSLAAACSANSAVLFTVNDWNAVNGSTRTYRTINGAAETESTYSFTSGRHTVYSAYRTDTGAAGSITQGLTTPSTMRWAMAGVEVLGTTSGISASLTSSTETDSVVSVVKAKASNVTSSTEIDNAVNIGASKSLTLTPAAETGTVVALSASSTVTVSLIPAVETDNVVSLAESKSKSVAPTIESNTSVVVVGNKNRDLVANAEIGIVVPLSGYKNSIVTPAIETGAAVALSIFGLVVEHFRYVSVQLDALTGSVVVDSVAGSVVLDDIISGTVVLDSITGSVVLDA